MDNLKNYRVSLKFSEKDAEQRDVAKLLKQLGRKKSNFITKAVKYYLENNPSPEIPGNNNIVTSLLTENIVKATILKMIQSGELSYNEPFEKSKKQEKEITLKKQNIIQSSETIKEQKNISVVEENLNKKYFDDKKDEKNLIEIQNDDIDNMLDMLSDF